MKKSPPSTLSRSRHPVNYNNLKLKYKRKPTKKLKKVKFNDDKNEYFVIDEINIDEDEINLDAEKVIIDEINIIDVDTEKVIIDEINIDAEKVIIDDDIEYDAEKVIDDDLEYDAEKVEKYNDDLEKRYQEILSFFLNMLVR